MKTCDTCLHSQRDFGTGSMVCRRYPPQVVIGPQGQVGSAQPIVGPTLGCGEHTPDPVLENGSAH